MTRKAYSKPPGDLFQQSTFRTEKSVSGLPSGSDREKEQALPEGAATPNSVSSDGKPADKAQGVGQRALPYGKFNGPESGSGTPEKSRTKGVPGEQYGTPSKDDYGYLTRRTMTGSEIDVAAPVDDAGVESDIVAYRPRKRGPSSYAPHPFGWRRHRQKPQQRNKRRKLYRRRRSRELQQARRRYRTRYRNNPRFKRRRMLCRKFPNRCKMRPLPRPKNATYDDAPDAVPFFYGCDLRRGSVVDVTPDGRLVLGLDDGTEMVISATAFVATAVFLDDSDIDTVDYLVESSEADEPYGDPTEDDVAAAATLHGVAVPADGTPDEQLEAIFEAVMSSCEEDTVTRLAHDTFLYDKTPASELSNNWLNRDEPTREVADTRPYKENAPGQWTRNRKDQTHMPSDGADTSPNPTYYQGGSGKVIPDDMRLAAAWGRLARFDLAPLSPLDGVLVDFGATRFDDPIEADEQGGFRVHISRIDLDGKVVRDPGVAVFLPQGWPFTDVAAASVSDVRLDDAVGMRFRDGRMVVTGRAHYTVQSEWGDTDERNIPVRGLMVLSPAFERRLDGMQAPPPDAGTVSPTAGDDSRVVVLIDLLNRVGDWGKPLVAQAIEAVRAGRPLDEETLKGIRYRMYRTNMRDEADMFRTASDRTAGVFQAPPGLVAAIEAWALPLYAGHVLAWVQSKLDAVRRDPTDDALANLARIRAEFPAAVASLQGPLDSVVVPAPKVNPDGTVGTYHIGVRMVEPDVYLLDVGDKRPTFRRREVADFPKSKSVVIHDVAGTGRYSIISQLEDRARRQAEYRKGDVPDDAMLVDLALIRNEARRYTDKAVSVKSTRTTRIPLTDAVLSGWRYSDRLPPDAIERLRANGKSDITVDLNFTPRQAVAGLWDPTSFSLELDIPTYRSVGLPYPLNVEEFRGGIARFRGTLRHEAQHAGQSIIQIALGLKEQAGLPPRSIRNLRYDPSGSRPGYRRQDHPERDIEFYSRLQDEIDEFVALSRRITPDIRARAMAAWTGMGPVVRRSELGTLGDGITTREFFSALKAVQREKWLRAVSEFVAGVRAAGVRVPTGGVLP